MINLLPGIGGSLLPGHFIATVLAASQVDDRLELRRRHLLRWWAGVEAICGPATGVRALFDLVAAPLFGCLGFRVRDVRVERDRAIARLMATSSSVALVVHPWAARSSLAWREVASVARDAGAGWCFLLAPPFLSLVDARGHGWRRSLDLTLPAALDPRSFRPFWTLTHAPAFDRPAPTTAASQIDGIVEAAARFQDHVRADLQRGVVEALRAVTPAVGSDHAFAESLTLVYRMLFLLFAESRDLVPRAHPVYGGAYALTPQCRRALRDGTGTGLWDGLAAATRLARGGCRIDDLEVAPFNGRLFARSSARSLEAGRPRARPDRRSATRDAAIARALAALGSRPGQAGRESISYADLGVEQLGAVYERVLDLDPRNLDAPERAGALERTGARHSHQRKETGTFYTPQALAAFVVRRTLAPLVSGATADQILSLRVVDPAMGSGAFLIAACSFLADAYARALVDEGRRAESDLDDRERSNIRRLVAERCLFGVDANAVAVQLARLSLWLTTLSRGKPLGFLEHRLRVGNSLIGARPDDMRHLDGRAPRAPTPLFDLDEMQLVQSMGRVVRSLAEIGGQRDDTVAAVRAKEAAWTRLTGDASPLRRWREAADLWCARWFWPERAPSAPEMRAALAALLRDDRTLPGPDLSRWRAQSRAIAKTHGFFHWPLEFSDVFYDPDGTPRERPGFDAVIGNPPWEMLRKDRPPESGRSADTTTGQLVRFVRDSGLYPACGRGHLNLYQPFLERSLSIARAGGRVGLVLPWGLAVDDGATALRARLLDEADLETLVGFDNAGALFPIHRGMRFLAIVASPGRPTREIRARLGVRTTAEIDDLPARDDPADSRYPVRLAPGRLAAFGEARRLPDVRSPRDLELLDRMFAAAPAVGADRGWAARFGRELNATDDRDAFGDRGLPVIEGKHLQPFTVDAAGAIARVAREEAARRLPDRRYERPRLAYRDVSAVGNRQSLIAAILPAGVVTTHTVFCLRTPVPLEAAHFLCGVFNSYAFNAVVRLLMGGHLTTSLVESLPVPRWEGIGRGAADREAGRAAEPPAGGIGHGRGASRRGRASLRARCGPLRARPCGISDRTGCRAATRRARLRTLAGRTGASLTPDARVAL